MGSAASSRRQPQAAAVQLPPVDLDRNVARHPPAASFEGHVPLTSTGQSSPIRSDSARTFAGPFPSQQLRTVEIVMDVLKQMGHEDMADNPLVRDVAENIVRQRGGNPFQAAELIMEVMAGNLSSDLGQPRTHTSTDAINSTSISLDSSTAETAAAEDIYNEIYADVLQKVSNPTEAMRLMDNLGFAHPCPEQNAVPGSPIHQPVHEFARSQCSPSGEIFLDLLHRTNGDTDAALEIMRNLGLGIGSDEIHRAEKSYRQLTCQPNTTASHNTTSPSSAPAPPTASITQASVEHPHQQPVADPGPGPCLHSPQQFSISGAAAVGTVLSPNTHGPQESNDRAQDMTRSGTLILSPPLRRGPPMVLVRSYQALADATDGFSSVNIIGAGGFGTVYRGTMQDGLQVAIKRLDASGMQGTREFMREVKILGRYCSANIVKLLGYAYDQDACCLVYELMDGSLDMQLGQRSPLPWQQRISIALQAAAGLMYLHRGTAFPLAHMDVKSANVLLKKTGESPGGSSCDVTAKIGDVGLAQLQYTAGGMSLTASGLTTSAHYRTHGTMPSMTMSMGTTSTSTLRGSNGYLDPVYLATGRGGSANDAYAFGVVLIELLTGRPAIYKQQEGRPPSFIAESIGGPLLEAADFKPTHPGSNAALLHIAKAGMDCSAGQWPDWAVDALACCIVGALLPDRSCRLKMDDVVLSLIKLHKRMGYNVPSGVLDACTSCGVQLL